MQEKPFDKNHPEYIPFSAAYIGHLMVDGVVTCIAAFCYWVLSLFFPILKLDLQKFITFTVLLILISVLVITLLQRPFVIKSQQGSPGGIGFALPEFIVIPILGTIGFYFLTYKIGTTLIFGLLLFCFCGLLSTYLQSWKPGLTRGDVREKYNGTKDMIHNDLVEEKYRDIEVDSSHKYLFKNGKK